MNDVPDRIPTPCPACSQGAETVHEVLSPGGGSHTVRCGDCGHVHKIQPTADPEVTLDVVVSQDDESFATTVTTPADETITHGDEFILETAEMLATVRVTSLELDGQRRVEHAVAEDVETVWTREVDNVSVNVTIHPQDGSNDESRSTTAYLPGDYELTVDTVETFNDDECTIDAIVVRGDASGYDRDRFEMAGDTVLAKDAKRVYAYDESSTAWSAW